MLASQPVDTSHDQHSSVVIAQRPRPTVNKTSNVRNKLPEETIADFKNFFSNFFDCQDLYNILAIVWSSQFYILVI